VATKVDGRGHINSQGDRVTFQFRASQSADSTSVDYFFFCDPAAGMCMTKGIIQSLSITGNTASFSGVGRLDNGTKVRFSVNVTDNGEPGISDTISISLTNGYSASGTLISGDIRIH